MKPGWTLACQLPGQHAPWWQPMAHNVTFPARSMSPAWTLQVTCCYPSCSHSSDLGKGVSETQGLPPKVEVTSRKIPCNGLLTSDCAETIDTENSISWASKRFWLLRFLPWNCLSAHILSAISSDGNREGQPTVTQSPYIRKYQELWGDQKLMKCVCTLCPQFYFQIVCFLHFWFLTSAIWPTKRDQCDL